MLVVSSLLLIPTFNSFAAQYDFSNLGTADSGFKPQGNRFLVSEGFSQDGASMYYDDGTHDTVTGMVIKPDGTNLASFDLDDMAVSPYNGSFTVSITITADLKAGGTASQSVSNYNLAVSGQSGRNIRKTGRQLEG